MSAKRNAHAADVKRAVIVRLLGEGLSLSQIAKQTGIGYKHVKQVSEQEKLAVSEP